MYIPQNRVITDLYTEGLEFVRIDNGEGYVGYYHKTYQGRFFSGKTPNSTNIVEIIEDGRQGLNLFPPTQYQNFIDTNNFAHNSSDYENLLSIHQSYFFNQNPYRKVTKNSKNLELDVHIHPYTHIPTNQEIEQGTFDMFLVIKNSTQNVTQIDKQSYNNILNSSDQAVKALYTPLTLPWVIKGEEEKVSQTNSNTIKTTQEKNFLQNNILVNYFKNNLTKNYLKYPGIIFIEKNTRITTDKKAIDTKLPEVYQLGNQVNYYANTNIPPNQNCSNCKFAKENNCSKWNAMIQRNYWCKAYDGEFGKGELLSTESTQPLSEPTPQQPTTTYSMPSPPSSTPTQGGGGYSGGGGGGGY